MKTLLCLLLLTLVVKPAFAANVTPIIPAPAHAEALPGEFLLTPATHLVADSAFANEARLLADRLHPATGFPLTSADQPVTGDIVLAHADLGPTAGPEGYTLTVTPTNVTICASTAAGAFYGCQSLIQLFPPAILSPQPVTGTTWSAPCVRLTDSPRFRWRGFMLDVSRHFFTVPEAEQVLDLLSLYKFNTFHWHLVDDQGWRIEIKKYPRLTEVGAWRAGIGFGLPAQASTRYDASGRYGGYYTQDEIRAVVAFAAARHITIVPEIEMPGHSSAALTAYPQFACANAKISLADHGGVFTGVYCAGKDSTFDFINDLLDEVAPLFPGPFIHIGGDEVVKSNWMACADCQARIHAEGLKNERELQSYFVRRVEKLVQAHGKTLIGWSEIREGGLSPGATLMDWIGGGSESAASGQDVVMSPTKFCYFDHYQSTNRAAEPKAIGSYLPLSRIYLHFEPVPAQLPAASAAHILGAQANLWTEYIPNLHQVEYMMFPRLGALAEVTWSPRDARDYPDFLTRTRLNEQRLQALSVAYRPLTRGE